MTASLEYLAVFFDGEGCITLCNGGRKYNVKCVCANTVKESVELFQQRFGGRVHPQRRPADKPHWKIGWKWVVDSRQAEAFLRTILPHLRVKAAVAQMAIRFLELPLKTKGRRFLDPSIQRANDEIQARREEIVCAVRKLNFRGIPINGSGGNLNEVN